MLHMLHIYANNSVEHEVMKMIMAEGLSHVKYPNSGLGASPNISENLKLRDTVT